jgi:heptosyltransferase-3
MSSATSTIRSGFFEANLKRAGVRNLVSADPRPSEGLHAAFHLARPMERYALFLDDPAPRFHPSPEDHAAAGRFLAGSPGPLAALHPGSGGARKNWPLDRWAQIARALPGYRWIITGGEADGMLPEQLADLLPRDRCRVARGLPLPVLGALFARCELYLGNDSGISHLAAAAGAPCVLVFGPTDPAIWAPRNAGVCVASAPDGELERLEPDVVIAAIRGLGVGGFT